MSPRPSLTATRRNEILAATSATIADRGLCETRIADIADHIGASPALILYYFPSKAALVTEALVYQDQVFHDTVKSELDSAGSAIAKLQILIEASCPKPSRNDGEPGVSAQARGGARERVGERCTRAAGAGSCSPTVNVGSGACPQSIAAPRIVGACIENEQVAQTSGEENDA